MTGTGFPHSEILGSRFVCQLPEAYRRLPRPSSAPGAKASTLCPYKLQPQKTKMLASTVQFSNNDQAHHQHPTPNPTYDLRRTQLAVPHQWPLTTPTPNPHPHPHKESRSTRPGARDDPKNQSPHGGCSLRTQQCVLRRHRPRPHPVPTQQAGRTKSKIRLPTGCHRRSTLSTTTYANGMCVDPDAPKET